MEQQLFDGFCPHCGGDQIEDKGITIINGKPKELRKYCPECLTSFTVKRKLVDVAEW